MNNLSFVLTGNPNVGKSSIFNELTGLRVHTGNWSGKTVGAYEGIIKKTNDKLIDLPGITSLFSKTDDEIITRDYLLSNNFYNNIVVVDATSLKKGLNLFYQIIEINPNVVLCLNMFDLIKNANIIINVKKLEQLLGIDVICCSTKTKVGVLDLKDKMYNKKCAETIIYPLLEDKIQELIFYLEAFDLKINTRYIAIQLLLGNKTIVKYIEEKYNINIITQEIIKVLRDISSIEVLDIIMTTRKQKIESICNEVINERENKEDYSYKIDKVITSKKYGIIISMLFLSLIFYITISLSNYPSEFLTILFNKIGDWLIIILKKLHIPKYIIKPLIFGIYTTLTWVVSVMLPPMMIFFSLFALGEESGILPRIAFNFDKIFNKCKCSGKQALTMCMGFGCNACAVVNSRIIENKKDRIISIVTNNFIPCNGRFPLLIVIITMFLSINNSKIVSSLILTVLIIFGITISFLISFLLSKILKNKEELFYLELPRYKKPKIFKTIYRSIIDKSVFVLFRAIKIAAPCGLIIWLFANITVNNITLLNYISNFLDPFASTIGLDGTILFSFILALPANEIVLPIILMGYLMKDKMVDMNNVSELKNILMINGWDSLKALSVCIFSLMHFPCATTLVSIKKEIGFKWTIISFLIPTIIGILLLFIINQL